MCDLLKKEMCGIFNIKGVTKKQKRKYVRSKYQITKNPEDDNRYKHVKNDVAEKIIKNCRGVKKCNDGVNRSDKEKPRESFRQLLGFKKMKYMKEKNTR